MLGLDLLGASEYRRHPRNADCPPLTHCTEIGASPVSTGPVSDTITNPTYVIVNPLPPKASSRFTGNVQKVVVSIGSGKRHHPFYGDANSVGYDNPATTTITLNGGQVQTYKGLQMLQIEGGKQTFDQGATGFWGAVKRAFMIGADTQPKDEYARTVESEFQALKALADKVGWPSDLAPEIVSIDKAWQDAKAKANAGNTSVVHDVGPDSALRGRIHAATGSLKSRLAPSQSTGGQSADGLSTPGASWFTQRTFTTSLPNYGVVAVGAGAAAVVVYGLKALVRSRAGGA